MKIARVFPTKTSMTPIDQDAYYDTPGMFMPHYDEVHISCSFTWDTLKARRLAREWEHIAPVRIGGVAIDGESDQPFQAGLYLRKGITITTRGCPNNCGFCIAGNKKFIEFDDFPEGNILQDNNILACSDHHWRLVVSMLKKQKAIEFKGGLDKYRLTPEQADDLRSLRIKTLWLACDQPQGIEPLRKAVNILLNAGFTRNHLYCYVLIGNNARENIHRLKEVYSIGCMPFAQLYQPGEYTQAWKRLQRRWARPMIIRKRVVIRPSTITNCDFVVGEADLDGGIKKEE